MNTGSTIETKLLDVITSLKKEGENKKTNQKEIEYPDGESSHSGKSESKLILSLGEALRVQQSKPTAKMVFLGIPDGPSLVLFVGPAKTGKTILLENLGYYLVGGNGTFLGEKISKRRIVLFISLEEFEGRRLQRNQLQLKELKTQGLDIDRIKTHYYVVPANFPRYLSDKNSVEQLDEIIKQVNPDILIIDSFSRMYSGAIENSEKAQKVIQPLKNYSDKVGIPIIIIHHTTKLHGKSITMDSMAGSRLLAQEADAIIGVGKIKNGLRYLKPLAYRYADDSVDKLPTFRISNNCVVTYEGHFKEDKLIEAADNRFDDSNTSLILEFITKKKTVLSSELMNRFIKSKKMSKSTLYKGLSVLEKSGVINSPMHGTYKVVNEDE